MRVSRRVLITKRFQLELAAEIPVLFAYIGWTRNYDGTDTLRQIIIRSYWTSSIGFGRNCQRWLRMAPMVGHPVKRPTKLTGTSQQSRENCKKGLLHSGIVRHPYATQRSTKP